VLRQKRKRILFIGKPGGSPSFRMKCRRSPNLKESCAESEVP
jgi:hypothetical protein